MEKIYPTEEARKALTVFEIYEGNGEYFVLYIDGLQRESFTFGAAEEKPMGYEIVKECIGCETCLSVCPQQCIFSGAVPFRIDQRHCLHCGNCFRVCPVGAVRRRKSHG